MAPPSTRIIVVTGAGGVGKTTISAALGVTAARAGHRTLVMTVDPARRLADALGLKTLGNDPSPVSQQPRLAAAMLDVTASWEAIARRHAPPDVAERLIENAWFRAIADRFPAAQAYAAGEQMADRVESGQFDLVIVDTPPAAGGIDFLLAPDRMQALIGGKVLRWLTGASLPGRRVLYRMTARPMLKLFDAVLGGPLLEDIAEFLIDMRSLYDGLVDRSKAIEAHFRTAEGVVVTTADPAPIREARRFFDELGARSLRPAAVVFNRALPAEWMEAAGDEPPGDLPPGDAAALAANLRRWGGETRRQTDARIEFAARHDTTPASIPWAATAPTTLDALADLIGDADGLPAARLGI